MEKAFKMNLKTKLTFIDVWKKIIVFLNFLRIPPVNIGSLILRTIVFRLFLFIIIMIKKIMKNKKRRIWEKIVSLMNNLISILIKKT